MREIKFRVWFNDQMTYAPLPNLMSMWKYADKKINPAIFMQFTGLKDKNGKEIYEGDIIRYNFKTKYDNQGFISEVFFDEQMWLTKEHSLNRINNVEVIGNIYKDKND